MTAGTVDERLTALEERLSRMEAKLSELVRRIEARRKKQHQSGTEE